MKPLDFGKGCYVPVEIARCPECGSDLMARSLQWDAETGVPDAVAIDIECTKDLTSEDDSAVGHAWRQRDWQPVRDKIAAWSGAATAVQAQE